MAALVVQSRFAGLKLEDEEWVASDESQKSKKKTTNTKKVEPTKKIKSTNKTQPQQTSSIKKKKTKQNTVSSEQWEQWKQKDEELVDGNYETELQQAILLSKLDYEEKEVVYKKFKKEADLEKKLEQTSRAPNKKQKKKNVMSLDQFNDLMTSGEDVKLNQDDDKSPAENIQVEKDVEFFERIKEDTKNELIKDKIIDRVRHRKPVSDEILNKFQFADALERKDKEIAKLKEEILILKQELHTVKSRNKSLYILLAQGEMKDKAEVLMEVERLTAVQSELTAEIASLHIELEKERSKNADPRTKDKKKKGANGEKDK